MSHDIASEDTFKTLRAMSERDDLPAHEREALHEAAIALAPNLASTLRFDRTDPRVRTRIVELVHQANPYIDGVTLGDGATISLSISPDADNIEPTEVEGIVDDARLVAGVFGYERFALAVTSGAVFEYPADGERHRDYAIDTLAEYLGS